MKQTAKNERTRALRTLYGVLDSGNSLSRCHAVRAIERLKPHDAESRGRLIDLLSDPDPDVRTDTAVALGNLEIGEATAALLNTLRKDHEGEVRIQAVIALSKIKSRDAVAALIECFVADGYPELDYLCDDMEYSPCWEVQSQAMEALGQIGDHRATQPLIEILESGQYDDLQERGFKVLAQLSEDQSRAFLVRQLSHESPRTRRRAAQGLGSLLELRGDDRNPPREILDALADALGDSDPGVRTRAAEALSGIDDAIVGAAITMLINDPDTEVRAAVAAILGKTKGPEILETLQGLLEEPDAKTKRSVVRILGQIGDSRSQQSLVPLLDTQDDDLLFEVLRSLGQIGTSGTQRRLAEILSSRERHSGVRGQAALALGNILRKTALPEEHEAHGLCPKQVLATTVFDDDEQLGCTSLSALVDAYPDEAVAWLSDIVLCRPLILLRAEQATPAAETAGDARQQDAEDEAPEYSLVTCGDAETSTLASIVVGIPGDRPVPDSDAGSATNFALRVFAARLMGGVATAGTPGVDALIEAFRSDDTALRRETVIALGRIGDEAALPVVFEALDSTHPEVRLAAVDVLQAFDMPCVAQERIDALCADADPNLRCAAISLLGSGPVAQDCLYRALADENQQVCRTALNNVSKASCSDKRAECIFDTIFRFSGELRKEAGAALQRVGDLRGITRLLDMLRDAEQEEQHWLCIDALAEFFAGAKLSMED